MYYLSANNIGGQMQRGQQIMGNYRKNVVVVLANKMQQSQWNLIAILSNSTLFDFTHNMRAQIISPVSLNHEPRKTC